MTPDTFAFATPPDEPVIEFRRFFKAPPSLIFQMFSDSDHVRQWWGPRVLELVTCDIDLRVGGSYTFVLRAPDGQQFAMYGTYQEITAPHRLASTFTLDVAPDNEIAQSFTFEEVDGGTLLHGIDRHHSIEARNQQTENGMMEAGLADQYLRLAELVESLPAL